MPWLPTASGSKTDFRKLFFDKRPVVLFCREKYSFDLLSDMRLPKNVEVRLSKDTSLYLTRSDLSKFSSFSARGNTLVCLRNNKESIIPKKAKRKIVEKLREKGSMISLKFSPNMARLII